MSDLVPFIDQVLCANSLGNDKTECCPKTADKTCQGCQLVQYCSRECQVAHWPNHKDICKDIMTKESWTPVWDTENKDPVFMGFPTTVDPNVAQQELWGSIPAFDLLNLEENEGRDTSQDIRILFASSGDMRNLVKTVVGIPETYPGRCDAVLNDRDIDVAARNAIFLLVIFRLSPEKAIPIVIHLWYSAMIPAQYLEILQEEILPLIEEVCSKVEEKPTGTLFLKTWKSQKGTLRLVFRRKQWLQMRHFLKVPKGLTADKANQMRTAKMLDPERVDFLHRFLFTQPPYWRVPRMKIREDGILLPFGSSRASFDTPNPTLYHVKRDWPFFDAAEPLKGWPLLEVLQKAPPAKNDIYGAMFFYLRDILAQFCRRIEKLRTNITIFCSEVLELPAVMKQYNMGEGSFDRIEVSTIMEQGILGLEVPLSVFSPLLKPKTKNPHATLLALFLGAIEEVRARQSQCVTRPAIQDEMKQARKYIEVGMDVIMKGIKNDPNIVRALAISCQFRDVDDLFGKYMKSLRFPDITKKHGLKIKKKHTIIERWPLKLKKEATQSDFELVEASGFSGNERYVEWGREK